MATLLMLHLLASIVVGWAGRHRRFGFFGFFLLSLVLSPLVAVLILVIAGPSAEYKASLRQAADE